MPVPDSGGGTFANVSATSYQSGEYFGGGDFFRAVGAGSLLDLRSLQSLNFDQDFGGAPVYTIAARDGGIVDLSEVTDVVVAGGRPLRLEATTGGTLRLGKLKTISGGRNVRITSDGTAIALPQLETIQGAVVFELAAGQTLNLPALTQVNGAGNAFSTEWKSPAGGQLNAPNLTNLQRVTLSLGPGESLTTGNLAVIDGSRFLVTGGQTFSQVTAATYSSTEYFGGGDFFLADGTNSTLDLSSLVSLNFDQDFGGAPVSPWRPATTGPSISLE